MNCPKITGVGVQWLVQGCPALSSLNIKGTKATLTTLNIIKERYPYSRIKVRSAGPKCGQEVVPTLYWAHTSGVGWQWRERRAAD